MKLRIVKMSDVHSEPLNHGDGSVLTWRQMVKIEPELDQILREIRAIRRDQERFCANWVWYKRDGFKARMHRLVGWRAFDDKMGGSANYSTAYQKLYNELPGCRNCNCL